MVWNCGPTPPAKTAIWIWKCAQIEQRVDDEPPGENGQYNSHKHHSLGAAPRAVGEDAHGNCRASQGAQKSPYSKSKLARQTSLLIHFFNGRMGGRMGPPSVENIVAETQWEGTSGCRSNSKGRRRCEGAKSQLGPCGFSVFAPLEAIFRPTRRKRRPSEGRLATAFRTLLSFFLAP